MKGLLILLLAGFTAAEAEVPEFSSYAAQIVGEPFVGSVKTKGDPLASKYKTQLTRALSDGPVFAGRFGFATWGCGTECLVAAIVDVKTGKVTFAPQGVLGYEYKIDSRLLVVNPEAAVKKRMSEVKSCGVGALWAATSEYWKWTGESFQKIGEINWCNTEATS